MEETRLTIGQLVQNFKGDVISIYDKDEKKILDCPSGSSIITEIADWIVDYWTVSKKSSVSIVNIILFEEDTDE